MSRNRHPEDTDDTPRTENWRALRNVLALHIQRADWEEADCYGSIEDMAEYLQPVLLDVKFSTAELKLALYDLNIPYERNEYNSKFYYLAKWS